MCSTAAYSVLRLRGNWSGLSSHLSPSHTCLPLLFYCSSPKQTTVPRIHYQVLLLPALMSNLLCRGCVPLEAGRKGFFPVVVQMTSVHFPPSVSEQWTPNTTLHSKVLGLDSSVLWKVILPSAVQLLLSRMLDRAWDWKSLPEGRREGKRSRVTVVNEQISPFLDTWKL